MVVDDDLTQAPTPKHGRGDISRIPDARASRRALLRIFLFCGLLGAVCGTVIALLRYGK